MSTTSCPRGKHRGNWPHGAPALDRFTDGSGWACPGLLADGSVCGYELRTSAAAEPDMVLVGREDLREVMPWIRSLVHDGDISEDVADRLSAAAEVTR